LVIGLVTVKVSTVVLFTGIVVLSNAFTTVGVSGVTLTHASMPVASIFTGPLLFAANVLRKLALGQVPIDSGVLVTVTVIVHVAGFVLLAPTVALVTVSAVAVAVAAPAPPPQL